MLWTRSDTLALAMRETIKREMTEAFSAYPRSRSMLLPSTVFIVTAERAG